MGGKITPLPCPFCGRQSPIARRLPAGYWLYCPGCWAMLEDRPSRQGMVAAWNQRPALAPCEPGQVLPCPLCASVDLRIRTYVRHHSLLDAIQCDGCDLWLVPGFLDLLPRDPGVLTSAWNTRLMPGDLETEAKLPHRVIPPIQFRPGGMF